jgi:hypothetical protein
VQFWKNFNSQELNWQKQKSFGFKAVNDKNAQKGKEEKLEGNPA